MYARSHTISQFNVQRDQKGINGDFMQEFSFQFKRNDSGKTFQAQEQSVFAFILNYYKTIERTREQGYLSRKDRIGIYDEN